jgi:hypothetical protein
MTDIPEGLIAGEVTAGYDGPSVVFPASDEDDKRLSAMVGQRVYICQQEVALIEQENREGWKQSAHWRAKYEAAQQQVERSLAASQQANAAMAKDAARYRWLRLLGEEQSQVVSRWGASGDPEFLDEGCDAAIAEQAPAEVER